MPRIKRPKESHHLARAGESHHSAVRRMESLDSAIALAARAPDPIAFLKGEGLLHSVRGEGPIRLIGRFPMPVIARMFGLSVLRAEGLRFIN